MMPFLLLAASLTMPIQSDGPPGSSTTIVRTPNGVAIITQSGDPAAAEITIERSPGRTTVYRRSGGNTSIVTQSDGSPNDGPDLRGIPWPDGPRR